MAILPKHLLEGENMQESDFFRAPVGTGPYKLESWYKGQTIVLEKNKDSIYPELERKSAKIENAMKNAGLNVNRVGSIMTAFFTDKKVVDYDTATTADTKRYAEYYNHLLENGIYAAPSQFEAMFVSFAHTEDDIEKTCQVIESFK